MKCCLHFVDSVSYILGPKVPIGPIESPNHESEDNNSEEIESLEWKRHIPGGGREWWPQGIHKHVTGQQIWWKMLGEGASKNKQSGTPLPKWKPGKAKQDISKKRNTDCPDPAIVRHSTSQGHRERAQHVHCRPGESNIQTHEEG